MSGTVTQSRRWSGRRRGFAAAVALLAAACTGPPPPAPDSLNAVVVAAVDGDTIDVEIGDSQVRVRLLAIDTPEIAHPGRDGAAATAAECFADEAHRFTRALLPSGSAVRIERDVVGRDHYDRVLGYVYRGDGVFVNYELVRHGFALPLSIEPNVTHAGLMVRAATLAERAGAGLWSECE